MILIVQQMDDLEYTNGCQVDNGQKAIHFSLHYIDQLPEDYVDEYGGNR